MKGYWVLRPLQLLQQKKTFQNTIKNKNWHHQGERDDSDPQICHLPVRLSLANWQNLKKKKETETTKLITHQLFYLLHIIRKLNYYGHTKDHIVIIKS